MKKLIVLSAIAVLAACGGSDNKPATDPTTSAPTGAGTSATDPSKAAPSTTGTSATPATTDTAKPADPTKK